MNLVKKSLNVRTFGICHVRDFSSAPKVEFGSHESHVIAVDTNFFNSWAKLEADHGTGSELVQPSSDG